MCIRDSYIPGELSRQPLAFRRREPIRLYASPNNPGARAAAKALQRGMGIMSDTGKTFVVVEALEDDHEQDQAGATHMLLYLNAEAFLGEAGARLADEVRGARAAGSPRVVMGHETDMEKNGVAFEDFGRFFRNLPPDLIEDGIFHDTAIALIPGAFYPCLLYTSPSPRDGLLSRMPSSA